jgi:uncharacterized membrane protein (UPF0127 family)
VRTRTLTILGIAGISAVVGVTALVLAPRRSGSGDLAGLDVIAVTIDGHPLRLAVPRDPARGQTGVEDLGDLDGMLFDYGQPVEPAAHAFWMQGVVIALDIAFFDGQGVLVARLPMPLCPAQDQQARTCPRFASPGPFRWAVETPSGAVVLRAGSRLAIPSNDGRMPVE